jgi:uncharacterized membrane protein YczE
MRKVSPRKIFLTALSVSIAVFGYGLFSVGLSDFVYVYRDSLGAVLDSVRNPSINLTRYVYGYYPSSEDLSLFLHSQFQRLYNDMKWVSMGMFIFGMGIAMIVAVGIEELKEKIDKLEAKLSQQTAPER